MHVSMEKTIAKHLGKKQGHPVSGQLLDVHTGLDQLVHLTDGHPKHALHHNHILVAVVPKHLGDQHQIETLHIAS